MSRARLMVVSVALLALFAASFAVAVRTGGLPAARVTASSNAGGSVSDSLLDIPRGTAERDASERDVAWQSDGETVGAWLQVDWDGPRTVDHVSLFAAGDATAVRSALLIFDDSTSLLATADRAGDVVLDFPPRTASTVRITIERAAGGATSVTLAGLVLDRSGGIDAEAPRGRQETVATASSSVAGPVSALTDGSVMAGDTGREWTADRGDASPWVELTLPAPREVSSVQVFGPTEAAFDPAYSAASALNGVLHFDDGSSVIVSGIAGGAQHPTTIAFAPRLATSVRLELSKTIPAAVVGLREISVHDMGTTPPRLPPADDGYATTPVEAATCAATESDAPVTAPALTLLCPEPGSSVKGTATIAVAAEPGTDLRASAWTTSGTPGRGEVRPVASGTADAAGRTVLSLDTATLAQGPVTIAIAPSGSRGEGGQAPLHVQLFNEDGQAPESPGYAPDGMTLQWAEEFDSPLPITATGANAVYAATKPAYWGTSDFGDAVFVDPALGTGTISTIDDQFLRIRAEPIGNRPVSTPYDQRHIGGILSSLQVGATGFAAQYGYFEARMLGAPGAGSWPAFWMLNTQAATRDSDTSGEVDAVELYGHNTLGSCHTLHSWDSSGDDETGTADCLDVNGYSDWSMNWHTYGVRIVPNGAIFYIDGVEVTRATGLVRHSEPYFFMVDLALGGGWPVDLAATSDVSELYVDWVRVYT